MSTRRKIPARKFLEKLTGGPTTFARFIQAERQSQQETMEAFATKLNISKQHLNDIEKGRKTVSPERAARFARTLGFSEKRFIQLALQDQLTQLGLKFTVQVS